MSFIKFESNKYWGLKHCSKEEALNYLGLVVFLAQHANCDFVYYGSNDEVLRWNNGKQFLSEIEIYYDIYTDEQERAVIELLGEDIGVVPDIEALKELCDTILELEEDEDVDGGD